MGRYSSPRVGLLVPMLLVLPLLASCASAPAGESGAGSSTSRFLDDLLPEPLGEVSIGENPPLFLAGWLGMIAGAAAGGWLGVEALLEAETADGQAMMAVLGVCVIGGALVGGVAAALPVKGIEEFLRWLFG
ncbi:MAG: hypothetical protein L6R43_12435 [Planctomycetes bacterium]|nr:hypothetical protein [Planctomycetota bacterium]